MAILDIENFKPRGWIGAGWDGAYTLATHGEDVASCCIFNADDLASWYWVHQTPRRWLVHRKTCEIRPAAAVAKGVVSKESVADSLKCAELKDHPEWAAKHLPCQSINAPK